MGDFEQGDPVEPEVRRYIESEAAIIRPGFVSDTAPYYALMDVLALPTYREGFPGVPLEAQASGDTSGDDDRNRRGRFDHRRCDRFPSARGEIYGGPSRARSADSWLIPNCERAWEKSGRERMEQDFHPEVIWDALVHLYRDLIEEQAWPFAHDGFINKISLAKTIARCRSSRLRASAALRRCWWRVAIRRQAFASVLQSCFGRNGPAGLDPASNV